MQKIFAEIEAYENVMTQYCEVNGLEGDSVSSVFVDEFGWLEQSGFGLVRAVFPQEDGETDWSRYICFLLRWAMEHEDSRFRGMSPPCFTEALECDLQ